MLACTVCIHGLVPPGCGLALDPLISWVVGTVALKPRASCRRFEAVLDCV